MATMKKLLLWIIIPLIAIQFIRLDVPATLTTVANQELVASDEVIQILKRSCYDCHSNHVNYPWYSHIAPMSWFTQSHVEKGRAILNFSTWNSYSDEEKIKLLDKTPKAIKIRMPLPTYLWLHKEAELSNEDRKTVTKWAEDLQYELE